MALPIRDGNQSLTTLSTILVSNAHIPAHTVISFGTQGITDIATAVSGVELGPNTLNALENITVTLGQVTITGGLTDSQLRASAVTIGGSVTATISGTASVTFSQAPVTFGTAVVTGSTSILNFPATQTVTFSQASVTFGTAVITGSTSIIGTPSVTFTTATITGSTSILNFPASQTVTFTTAPVTFGTAVVTGSTSVLNFPATQTVTFTQASVTFGTAVITGSASILNFPATQTVTFSQASVTFGTAVITGSTSIIGTPSVTFTQASVTFGQPTITGSVSILNLPATQTVTFTTAPVTFGTSVVTGSVSVLNIPATQTVTFSQAPVTFGLISGTVTANPTGTQTIAGTVTANTRNNGINNDPWVYIPRLTMSHPDLGNFVFDGYYRFDGVNQWGNANFNSGNVPYLTRVQQSDDYFFRLMVHDENNDAEIEMAIIDSSSPDFPTGMVASGGTLVSGSLTFNTEQRESYGVRVTNSVTIGSAIPAGTNRIGVVTIGAGTVTIGAGTAQIGSVTASISGTVPISISSVTVGNSVTISSLPSISGTVTANVVFLSDNNPVRLNDAEGNPIYLDNGNLPISGTVTANTFAVQGTAVTTSNFTSTTASTVLASFNATREVLTIFNEGAGNLHICAGATCTTIAYQVRLSAGDYYEVPNHQTTITHSAVFATAGTARVTQVS